MNTKQLSIVMLFFFIYSIQKNEVKSQDYPLQTSIQRGHYELVNCICFSNNGRYLVSGSKDKTAKLWEVNSGREVRTFIGHTATINSVCLDSATNFLLTSSSDATVKLWNVSTGELVRTFQGLTDRVTSAVFSPDGKYVVAGGYNWQAKIWELRTGKEVKEFDVSPSKTTGYGIQFKFSPNGKILYIGSDDYTMFAYDFPSMTELFKIKNSTGQCGGCPTLIDISSDGKMILTGSNGGPLNLWNADGKQKIRTFDLKIDYYTAVAITGDLKWVMASDRKKIRIWNLSNGELVNTISMNTNEITNAAIHIKSGKVASSSTDNSIKIWDLQKNMMFTSLTGVLNSNDLGMDLDPDDYRNSYIKKYVELKTIVSMSRDGRYLAKGKIDSVAKIIDIKSGKIIATLKGHKKGILAIQFSPDGKNIATAGADYTVKIWEFPSGKLLRTLSAHTNLILNLQYDASGTKLISNGWDGNNIIWNAATGEKINNLPTNDYSVFSSSFYLNDLYLIFADLGKNLTMVEPDSKKEIRTFIGHTDVISDVDISTDNKLMLSSSWDGSSRVWNIESGLQVFKVNKADYSLNAARFLHTSHAFIAGGTDGIARWYDISSGKLIKTFSKHTCAISSIQISGNDSTLVTCSVDGTIKIWDMITGNEMYSFIFLDSNNWMAYTPQGIFDATEGAKKSIHFVKGNETFSPDQFFDDFYRPGMIQKAVNQRSIIKKDLNLNDQLKQFPPPSIEIISPTEDQTFESNSVVLKIQLTDNGGGIGELRISQNGKCLPVEFRSKSPGKGSILIEKVTITLVSGENNISISAFSNGRIESQKTSTKLFYSNKSNLPTCYLMAVGINKYKNTELTLDYAKDDALAFVQSLSEGCKPLFKEIKTTALYDNNAGKEIFLKKLEEIATQAGPEDVFIFFYAGHGVMIDDKFYFIPFDCVRVQEEESLVKEAIYAGDVQERLKKIKALKQLIIMDACQSGGSTEILSQRGAAGEKAIAQLSRSAGVHVMASAGSEQYASEIKQLKHGLFTYVLLEAMKGKADGAPKDGKVTIYELKSYLDDQVPEISKQYKGDAQYPYTFSKGNDFPVIIEK